MDVSLITHSLAEHARAHPDYIFSAFFISGIVSGLPVLGVLLPASIFQMGLSSAAAHMELNPLHVLFSLIPGLLMGDLIGFLFGHYFNHTIKQWPPFKKRQSWFERTEMFFQKYGGITIIIGRISGPLRTITPIGAGILEMPYRHFFLYDCLAAMLWCLTHVGSGYLAANPHLWHQLHLFFEHWH